MTTSTITFIYHAWFIVLIAAALFNHAREHRLLFFSASYVLAIQTVTLLVFTYQDIGWLEQESRFSDYIYLAIPPIIMAIGLYLINNRNPDMALIVAIFSLSFEALIAAIIFIDHAFIPLEGNSALPSNAPISLTQWQIRQASAVASHIFVAIALLLPAKAVVQVLSFEDITELFNSVEYHVNRMPDGIVKKDSIKHLEAAAILLFDFDENGVNKQYTRCALTLINHVIKQARLKNVQSNNREWITDNQG
ncbi:hypothetical protein KIH87_01390 [Paraneptunicella aestuarii]|uniref:hypothetical protein n=1 Tax=Paraneptunicella aestuarii TaxID=2831148 RepID=UPI001E60CAE4|nr:hypothetical protein [Paraneptunicella aestuarii]UAA39051.1 hypothetical protein KIH87_01390 [Paraneptunicella aestuarii]